MKIFQASDGSTVLASQTSWTANAANNTLAAALNLNTANMQTAFPALPGGFSTKTLAAILEFQINDGTGELTCYKRNITIDREWNTTGSPVAIPGVTYYNSDEINALFARKLGEAGGTITLTSPNGTYQRILGVNNDGSGQDDIV